MNRDEALEYARRELHAGTPRIAIVERLLARHGLAPAEVRETLDAARARLGDKQTFDARVRRALDN